jgi:hypothetical protein
VETCRSRTVLLTALALAPLLVAADSGPLHIPRVSRAPILEYFLSNTPREAEVRVDDFRQYSPGDGAPVSQPTTAYLSYDDRNLYAVFVCKDDPELIRARMGKRELIMSDDRVTINLDTFHDHHRAYWFDVNPLNIQADGTVIDGVEDTTDWDAVWHSEARITADGYVVLMSIPFKMLRFPGGDQQTWGLVLGRIIQRNNEMSLWPHISKGRPGWVQQAGDMTGLRSIAPGRNVQLIPYGFFSRGRYLETAGVPGYRTENEPRAGLDAKMVIKEAFTLDLALNPDFSQVESDEPQVTVNQRFEVFFPEKRPFFLDNAGLFKTPQSLFFSRRIVDPRFGSRLTGKWGRWGLGVLAIDDTAPGARATAGVLRLQREFLRDSNIGVLATSRDFETGDNRVAGVDARIRVLPNWVFSGQASTSQTRERDGSRLDGSSYIGTLEHAGRHFISETSYTDVSPGFRAHLGYVPRADIRVAEHTTGYRWRPEGRGVVSFGPEVSFMSNWDRTGRVQDWSINPQFAFEFPRLTYLTVGREQVFELYAGQGFRQHTNEIIGRTQWFKWMALSATYRSGAGINYYPASGLAPFVADSTYANLGLTLHPSAQLKLEQTYIWSRLETSAASIFNNHILRSKANYQFTRELSLRTIADYSGVLPNPTLVKLDRSKHIGLDVLLTYMLHPGTALHAGYTDLYDNLAINPAISPVLRRTGFPDLSTGRQIFVKFSYRFQL